MLGKKRPAPALRSLGDSPSIALSSPCSQTSPLATQPWARFSRNMSGSALKPPNPCPSPTLHPQCLCVCLCIHTLGCTHALSSQPPHTHTLPAWAGGQECMQSGGRAGGPVRQAPLEGRATMTRSSLLVQTGEHGRNQGPGVKYLIDE